MPSRCFDARLLPAAAAVGGRRAAAMAAMLRPGTGRPDMGDGRSRGGCSDHPYHATILAACRISPRCVAGAQEKLDRYSNISSLAVANILPCSCHALAMLPPCSCHALATLVPCSGHSLAMLLPCSCHAIAMLWPCSGQTNALARAVPIRAPMFLLGLAVLLAMLLLYVLSDSDVFCIPSHYFAMNLQCFQPMLSQWYCSVVSFWRCHDGPCWHIARARIWQCYGLAQAK